MPKGRLAEDGVIDERYRNLKETVSDEYSERTRMNIEDSDATLILSDKGLDKGSELTLRLAKELGKPFLYVENLSEQKSLAEASAWLRSNRPDTLNVAGPRASQDSGIYDKAKEFLTKLFNKICCN